MSIDRPTFSPMWHRVRPLKPRLRPHVQITRQHYRGRRWHVVHDPAANQFYRLTPVGHEIISSLDGSRTVEEAWEQALTRHGDAAPTQPEVVELLGQLYNANLLALDAPPEVEQLMHRRRERIRKRVTQQAIGLMYFRLRLLNPDAILTALEPIFRPVLNRWGFLTWCVLVLAGLIAIIPEWPRLVGRFDEFVAPANAGWMLVIFVLLKLWHELGHGVICKRLGGQVPEAGVMLLVLLPSPYVDASSAWSFSSKWQRMAVGAGGMIFELTLAAAAAFVWILTPDGSLAKQLAYFTMLTASIATIVFNINPLMRFDGYYILADLIEVPNLMSRSSQHLNYLVQRYVFRLDNPRAVSSQPGERAILVTYGLLAMVYRVFVFVAISLWIVGQWFIIGLFLACWSLGAWFLIPTGKFIHWLATNPSLTDRRASAILTSIAALAALALLVGALPLPDWRRSQGIVQSATETGIFFETDGFVREAFVRPGSRVAQGDPIARLESPELERAIRENAAALEEIAVIVQQARGTDDAGSALLAQSQQALLEQQRTELEHRRAGLNITAPHAGIIVGSDPMLSVGAFMKRGQLLCAIVDPSDLRVAATLPTGEGAWFNEIPREQLVAQLRTASRPWRVVETGRVWSPAAAQGRLPHAALGFLGGGQVQTQARDEAGLEPMRPHFTIYLEAAEGLDGQPLGQPGERVWVRFALPNRPLLGQLIDRIQKTLQGRVNL
jgi:putative peptide zinc metalloprotease protein